jgi:hypothetical protein
VVKREELKHINVSDAHKVLGFQHSPGWRPSVVQGARRGAPFISTTQRDKAAGEATAMSRIILLHQDGGGAGRPREHLAEMLPRTVLSTTNAIESPTALLARREMQSWRLLQLEPSSLRNSDSFNSPAHLGADGSHLAATLYRLARTHTSNGSPDAAAIYARVANRLSELVEDVFDVAVDEDHRRELLTLQVRDRSQRLHAARALSDGTLRFLALAILELDPSAQGLLCFEEPENGIHPERIPAMVRLLKDLSVDVEVLRLYELPPPLERELLDLFAGWPRVGVPFRFDGYFPPHFGDCLPLHDLLAIGQDWRRTNHRRDELIEKKVGRSITPEESKELGRLQELADLRVRLVAPLPRSEIEQPTEYGSEAS